MVDTFRARRAPTVHGMERQAGLGRSLEDVLDSLPPVEPTDPAPNHVLFGIAPDDLAVVNGTSTPIPKPKHEKKTKHKKSKQSDGNKKKKSKKKKSKR
jgi:hypothetical protein